VEKNPYQSPDLHEARMKWRIVYRQVVGDAPMLALILIVEVAVLVWVFGLSSG